MRAASLFFITLGLVLLTQDLWYDLAQPHIFTPKGDYIQGGFRGFVAQVLLLLRSPLSGPLMGFTMLLGGAIAFAYRGFGTSASNGYGNGNVTLALARSLCAAILVSLTVVIAFTWPFFSVKPGASIRPMGYVFFIFFISGISFLAILTLAGNILKEKKYTIAGLLGCLFSITPPVTTVALVRLAQNIIGFQFAE